MYATPSRSAVDSQAVERLNRLKGLSERNHLIFSAAARTASPDIGGMLQLRAAEWQAGAGELHRFIVDLNGIPEHGGSAETSVHVAAPALAGPTPNDVESLDACIRAELDAAEAYQYMLELDPLPTHLRHGLSRQLESSHDSRLRLRSRLGSVV